MSGSSGASVAHQDKQNHVHDYTNEIRGNRGNNRENIFIEGRNYFYFMQLYEKYIAPVADTFAYCLLGNHFHFLVRIREAYDCQSLQGSIFGLKKIENEEERIHPCEVD